MESDSTNDASKLEHIRKWLESNKVFFEVGAATILGIMGVIISFLQYWSGQRQTDLVTIQTELAKQQQDIANKEMENLDRARAIAQAADWSSLLQILNTFNWKYQYIALPTNWKKLSLDEQLNLVTEISKTVTEVGKNPLVIERKYLFNRYLDSQYKLQLAQKLIPVGKVSELTPNNPRELVFTVCNHLSQIHLRLGMFGFENHLGEDPFGEQDNTMEILGPTHSFPWNPVLREDLPSQSDGEKPTTNNR